MRRDLEPVDMMVAVGVFATVVAGYALFWATSGALPSIESGALPMADESGMRDAREWVQPALGRAIVEEAVTERDGLRAMTGMVQRLNDSTMADHRLQAAPFGHVDRIGAYADAVTRDHRARVQFVLGRAVTNFTTRGVRSGVLTPETLDGEYNRVMIAMAESSAYQMEEAFQEAWQGRLGKIILEAGQDYLRSMGDSQGRIGRSIVGVALAQDAYRAGLEDMQEQLGSVAWAVINSEQAGSIRSASAEVGGGAAAGPATQPRTWPELPIGALVAASTGLIVVFLMGMSLSMSRPSRRARPAEDEEAARLSYRKTA